LALPLIWKYRYILVKWRLDRPSVRLSVRPSVRLSLRVSACLFIRPSIRPFDRPSFCPTIHIHLSIHKLYVFYAFLYIFFLSFFLSLCVCLFLSFFLSFFLSLCVCLFVCFFLSFFLSLFLSFSLSFFLRIFFHSVSLSICNIRYNGAIMAFPYLFGHLSLFVLLAFILICHQYYHKFGRRLWAILALFQ
jgi:hypothetical protein